MPDQPRPSAGALSRVLMGRGGVDPVFRAQVEDFILQHGYVALLELARDCAQSAILRITQQTMEAVYGALHGATIAHPEPPPPPAPAPRPPAATASAAPPRPPSAPRKKKKRGRPPRAAQPAPARPTPPPAEAPAPVEEPVPQS